MERWRKRLAVAALAAVALLCMTGVFIQGAELMRRDAAEVAAAPAPEVSEIQRFKTAREQLRAMMKAQLNDVAHGADGDPELQAMAQKQLVELCEREEQELTLEGVLALRGWEEPVVTVHRDSVNVLLKADVVTAAESAAILELVCRETGAQSGNVKIIPMN